MMFSLEGVDAFYVGKGIQQCLPFENEVMMELKFIGWTSLATIFVENPYHFITYFITIAK